MPKGNSKTQQLVDRIEEARSALDAALKLLRADGKEPKQTKTARISRAVPMKTGLWISRCRYALL